jgi:hypothetical protein
MGITHQEVVQDQITENAHHAVRIAAADGLARKNAFVKVLTRVKTMGDCESKHMNSN